MMSPNIQWILDSLKGHQERDIFADDAGPAISVNALTGKASAFYEKVRYLVDYKEEHTVRRSAIERILKRQLLIVKNSDVGLRLLQELVSAGYLPTQSVPESLAYEIQSIVHKYQVLGAGRVEQKQLISLTATEIERLLYPQFANELVGEAFYAAVVDQVDCAGHISLDTLKNQTYIACRRMLLADDHETLMYALLIKFMPELPQLKIENAEAISDRFEAALHAVDTELVNQLSWKIGTKLQPYAVYFSAIKEIVNKYDVLAENIFSDTDQLTSKVTEFLDEKYAQQKELLNSSGNRAVIYVLTTKIILALGLELPYEKFFLSHIDYLALGTNVVFHPLLLLVMVKTTPSLTSDNTSHVIAGVQKMIIGEVAPIHIKPPVTNPLSLTLFGLLYTLIFSLSFGFILWVLTSLHFNIVSIILFLFFLTFVSYLGYRIRQTAQKWRVTTNDDGFFSLLWSFITFPIVRVGRWLTQKFSSINLFVFIMDFILETPFKLVLGTFDSFMSFIKDQKDDMY